MNKLRTILKLVAVMAIASVLFSCAPKAVNLETLDPNTYDQSWLTGKPCAAPCWYGLEPGVSTWQDSVNRVEQLPFVDRSSIKFTNLQNLVGLSISFRKGQSSSGLAMDFESDVLDSIYISPNYRITFDQAVEKLGAPDGYWLQPDTPETFGCRLLVIWKNQRIELSKDDGEMGWFSLFKDLCRKISDRDGKLPENMVIEGVQIDSPDGIKAITNSTAYNPWEGFAR
jgi:hypothetical protein